jgi:hypothetical protein
LGSGDLPGLNGLSASAANTLRTSLPNAMVKTYTYRPLVGVLQESDPRGLATHYEYNINNKLIAIRDNDLKLLNEFEYNYNQNFDPSFGCTAIPGSPYPTMTLREGIPDRGATYYTFRVIASGGTGAYQYEWYKGIGPSSTNFESTPAGNLNEFTLFIRCDETQFVKVVATSGSDSITMIFQNGNSPCLPGEDPDNIE